MRQFWVDGRLTGSWETPPALLFGVRQLVGAVRKVEFKLLQLKPAPGLLIASTREDAGATLILITAGSRE